MEDAYPTLVHGSLQEDLGSAARRVKFKGPGGVLRNSNETWHQSVLQHVNSIS